jgi:hypothetical protein
MAEILDFHPIPRKQRTLPPRVRNVSARLYVNKYEEHREVEKLRAALDLPHGDITRTVVRALLAYKSHLDSHKGEPVPDFYAVPADAQIELADEEPPQLSARLRIDAYFEHREAYEFLLDRKRTYGEGSKTLVRALLYWRDTALRPAQARLRASGSDEHLAFDA